MIQYKKILMTLALLLTAAAGAWAQESESITTTLPETKEGSVEFTGTHFKITGQRADGDGMNLGSSTKRTITISALNGEIITKVEMTIGFKFYSWQWEVLSTKGNVSGNYTSGYNLTLTDVNVSEVTLSASNTTTGFLQFNKFKIFYVPAGTMVLDTDNTVATMAMPAYDATVEYELVRDMSVDMTTKVGDGEDGYRIRIKKDGESFVPAEMTLQEMMGLYKVHDGIENQDLVFYGDGKVCDISIFAVDDQDQPTGDAIAFTALTPGRYVAIATAAQGTIYDGQTPASNIFVLYQGYEVTVPATEGEVGETVDLGTVSFYTEEFNLKLDLANQAKLYTLTAIDGSTVTATQVDVVPAGMPFFVLNEDDVEQMVTLIPADDNELPTTSPLVIAEFLGATEDLTFTQDDMDGAYNYYVLYKGAFVWVKDPGTLKAGKCYLRVPKNQPTTARRIVFGDATAVYDLNDKSEMINDNYYDLNGRKVNAPKKKGVYIQNGRKVVVK